MQDPEFASQFYIPFVEDTIKVLKELKTIPEIDRVSQILNY